MQKRVWSIEKLRKLAAERGGRCLSKRYIGLSHPVRLICSEGHRWTTRAKNLTRGLWCPDCGKLKAPNSTRGTLAQMQKIADDRGGRCLSKKYSNNSSKLLWECANRHAWSAVPSSIQAGSWCPICASGLGERICRVHFERLFRTKFAKTRPKWLVGPTGRPLELDGYSSKLKLAFEHQGEQHFRKSFYATSASRLKRQKAHDLTKRILCAAHGVALFEIPELGRILKPRDLKAFIKKQCETLGVSVPRSFDRAKVDLRAAYSFEDFAIYLKLQKHAQDREGRLLSSAYAGSAQKLRWQCARGHIWSATPMNILNRNSWCPTCNGGVKGTLQLPIAEAKKHRGECLSKRYKNANQLLRWRCAKNHIFKMSYGNVQQGGWCRLCSTERTANSLRSNIATMRNLAAQRGGFCRSDLYINNMSPLIWECAKGHKWLARPGNVKTGTWCPICAGRRPRFSDQLSEASFKVVSRSTNKIS